MRLRNYSAGLALLALLLVACTNSGADCAPSATTGVSSCQSLMCPGTTRDCKNGAADGCETDTANDIDNCGACGNKCPTPANGEAACVAGVCGVATCGTRYRDCNSSPSDGCEIDTFRDIKNCGACGNVCPSAANAAAACIQGKCQLACQATYLDCNGDPSDGCETNGAQDLGNCGNCGNQCPTLGSANVVCAAGSCVSTTCSGTHFTCAAGPIDSCEVDRATDVNNCGACGNQCAPIANGTPGCTASNCGIKSCNPHFSNCDNDLTNGCEVDTSTDVKNCSACGNACPALANATPGCANSACTIKSCTAGYADCDKDATNGCESNGATDSKNCGACGTVCGAGMICYGARCVVPNRVLMAAAERIEFFTDIQTRLLATGLFTAVDYFDARLGTPTLTQLQGYEVVLTFSDFSYNDQNGLGNVLADYFDAGGRVVVTTFANGTDPILGRWASGGYGLIDPSSGYEEANDHGAIQILDATSPLVTGVKTLTADRAFRSLGKVINGGVVVATWGSGTPLVVAGTKNGHKLVGLNFFPPSSAALPGLWVGDGTALLVNALNYY